MISECLVSYMCLDYERKLGHSGMDPVKCVLNTSCNLYTYELSSWNLKKHIDTKIINRDQETHYTNGRTKFEEFILIHEAINVEQGHSYVPLIIKLPWATWVNEHGHWG